MINHIKYIKLIHTRKRTHYTCAQRKKQKRKVEDNERSRERTKRVLPSRQGDSVSRERCFQEKPRCSYVSNMQMRVHNLSFARPRETLWNDEYNGAADSPNSKIVRPLPSASERRRTVLTTSGKLLRIVIRY